MKEFLTEHAAPLAKVVKEKYDPLYKGATEEEWRTLHPLMKKKLKGRDASGLFVAQKHCAAAMKRAIDRSGWVTLVGEMGTGKTATSLATAALHDQWPVLVMCPTHITKKWAKEVADVIPGAKGFVINDLAEMIHFHKHWKPGDKWVAIISKEDAKLAPGFKQAYHTRTQKVKHVVPSTGRVVYFTADVVVCPKCGQAVNNNKDNTILAESSSDLDEVDTYKVPVASKDKRLVCTNPKPRWQGDPHDNTKGKWIKKDSKDQPYICGEPLWQVNSHKRWHEFSQGMIEYLDSQDPKWREKNKLSKTLLDAYQGERYGDTELSGDRSWGPGEWVTEGIRRWPIAEYIHDHLRGESRNGFFKLFIADEVHEYKAKDSAQAMAYHSIRDAIPGTINLTGTIFNGKSTSLFWLLYRNDPEKIPPSLRVQLRKGLGRYLRTPGACAPNR